MVFLTMILAPKFAKMPNKSKNIALFVEKKPVLTIGGECGFLKKPKIWIFTLFNSFIFLQNMYALPDLNLQHQLNPCQRT